MASPSTNPNRSASAQRRRRQRKETRVAILEAAEALLNESGDDDFSMRRLAERCGYTAPTLYQHFGDKHGLIDALLEARFEELTALLEAALPDADPVERVRRSTHLWLAFGFRNPAVYRLLLAPAHQRSDRVLAAFEKARALLEAPMDEIADAGRLAMGDRTTAQQAMFALTHGLTSLTLSRPDLEWNDDRFEIAIDAMLRGLIAPGPDAASDPDAPVEKPR